MSRPKKPLDFGPLTLALQLRLSARQNVSLRKIARYLVYCMEMLAKYCMEVLQLHSKLQLLNALKSKKNRVNVYNTEVPTGPKPMKMMP